MASLGIQKVPGGAFGNQSHYPRRQRVAVKGPALADHDAPNFAGSRRNRCAGEVSKDSAKFAGVANRLHGPNPRFVKRLNNPETKNFLFT
jgi:hypothetical protein